MKLLLVDDHKVVREGVRRLLTMRLHAEVIEAGTGREALTMFRADKPDLVLLDLNLPGAGGLDLLRRLLIEDPKMKVLIFSMHTTNIYVANALQAGAKGYISKGAGIDELVEAIRTVMGGAPYVEGALATGLAFNALGFDNSGKDLSARELDIMRLLAKGKALSEIADALGVSYKTVANACTNIKHKLLVERTSDLIRVAVEMHAS